MPRDVAGRLRALVIAIAGLLALIDLVIIGLLVSGVQPRVHLGFRFVRPHDLAGAAEVGVILCAIAAAFGWRHRFARSAALLGAVTMIVLAVAIHAGGARRTFPAGDRALLESYTHLATEGRILVGPYSRFGWHHPGPLYFWIAAPFYALAKNRSAGLEIAVLFINVGSLAVAAWISARFASHRLFIVLLVATAGYVWRISNLFLSVWNPYVPIMPAVTLVIICAAIASGRTTLIPLAALFASFVAQTHIGLLPYAVALPAAAIAASLWMSRTAGGSWIDSRTRRNLHLTAWLLVVLWSGPIADQMVQSPGNLTQIWRFFGAGHVRPLLGEAFVAWGSNITGMFVPDFQLASGPFVPSATAWLPAVAVLQLVLLVAAVFVFRARESRFDAAFAALTLLAFLISFWSVSRVVGQIPQYSIAWVSGVGMLGAAATVAALLVLIPVKTEPRVLPSWAVNALCGALVVGVAAVSWQSLQQRHDVPRKSRHLRPGRQVRTLFEGVRTYINQTGTRRPLIRINGNTWSPTAGLVLQLQLAGVDFGVEQGLVFMFTPALGPDGTEDAEITIAGRVQHRDLVSRPGNVVIAQAGSVYADAVRVGRGSRRR